jgi:hypothetical protein
MSGSALLASHALQQLTTIEIEPLMVEGSRVFQPVNESVLSDPRSHFAFEDAKSFFSSSQDRFDVIFAEPSNPWVSGVSSLFSIEFYQHISARLTPTGMFGQWIQVYELDDPLFLSILAALDAVFPSYRGYLVATADVAIVASTSPNLPAADWSVLDLEGVRQIMDGAPPFTGDHLDGLLLFDETTFRGVLDGGVPANSDYRPVLDLGSERARFLDASAEGLLSLAHSRFDLLKNLAGAQVLPQPYAPPPALGLAPLVNASRTAWARQTVDERTALPNEYVPEWSPSVAQLRDFLHEVRGISAPESWVRFANDFVRAEAVLHWGTTGWADEPFFAEVYAFLERTDAPVEARAAVDLMHAVDTWDWALAASAADLLRTTVDGGRGWDEVGLLLDASVTAYLKTGRPEAAKNALDRLLPHTERAPRDLRNQLLETLIAGASPGIG